MLTDYEMEAISLLVADVLTPDQIDAVLTDGEFAGYEYTGPGYFLSLRHAALPIHRIVRSEPMVSGEADGILCGFIVFIENGELTLECHSWGDPLVPEDFRDRNVRISTAPTSLG